jgi:hypothetical protein
MVGSLSAQNVVPAAARRSEKLGAFSDSDLAVSETLYRERALS